MGTRSLAQTVPDSAVKDTAGQNLHPALKDSSGPELLTRKKISNSRGDSLRRDSARRSPSLKKIIPRPVQDSLDLPDTSSWADTGKSGLVMPISTLPAFFMQTLAKNPDFNFLGEGQKETMEFHRETSHESIFYLLIGILFYFAFFKVLFAKYLRNLFTLFFLVSMRQQQIREQVLQSPLPSLLLNILFVISGGLYITFLIRYSQLAQHLDFWFLLMDSIAILSLIYLGKFLFLKFSGWIFKISRATDMYIFVIFLTNKVLGIFLLPFLLLLSFSESVLRQISITISVAMIVILFFYRFLVSFNPVRKEIKVRGFHFFLYLCAFEIAPLLLIYKVLLSYLEKAH
jgi:hypothetical protein